MPGGSRLAAYLVARLGQPRPGHAVLRAHLAGRLPAPLLPGAFMWLEVLPLSAHGKLDQRALPAPAEAAGVPYQDPVSAEEQLLCALVGELLGRERVGAGDDFFALGGDSLLAARLAAQVRARLGRELPLRLVFAKPVLAYLAAALRGLPRTEGPALRPRQRPGLVPASPAQRRLWFLHRLEGTAAATYNMPLALRLRGRLDAAALRCAFGDVVARHESLRTLLVERDGEPWQEVLPATAAAGRLRLEVRSCTPAELEERRLAAAWQGFDLAADLPLRALLLTLGAEDHELLIVQHHVSGDGWSWGPLLRDLGSAYAARAAGHAPALPPLPVQYADHALWQRAALGAADDAESRLGRELGWWRQQLAGLPEELALPADRPRPPSASHRGGQVTLAVPADLHRRLRELAHAHGATLFMVLQAGVAALLHRLGAGADIPLGTAHAGRGEAVLDDLVGFFVGTLVLRCDLSGRPSFAELLARVRAVDLAAFAHAETPFELVVDAVAPERALARHPLFQVMVVLQNNPPLRLQLAGVAVEPVPLTLPTAKLDLAFEFEEQADASGAPVGLLAGVEYSAERFEAATARLLLERLLRLLEAAVQAPELPIGRLELLAPEERELLLVHHNATTAPIPMSTVVELLQAQAARTPGATAVIAGTEERSYAALHAQADRLARLLIGRGIGRRRWPACTWSARRFWSRRCWRRSRPAAPSCRSIPNIPRSASPPSSPTPRQPAC